MKDKVITTYFFDPRGRFAGFRTYDVITKDFEDITADLPEEYLTKWHKDDKVMMKSY